jgi:tRNA (guanine-N7-)-methyltransferase
MSVRRGKRLPLEALGPYLLTAPEPPARLSWPALFGNDHPVELEVGFGKGLFLVTSAQARPDVNFVGVEIVRKYQLFTATRIAKRGLANVRLACADARLFLRAVEPASVHVLHVYFPDPWWKTRHHKRRLFTAEFVQEAVRVLRPGGVFSIATDVGDYFAVMKELLAATPLEAQPPPEPGTPAHDLDYLTNFERKARKKGEAVYRLLLRKPVSP